MDLLFSKYASPYLLIDQVIEEGRFVEFIFEFAEAKREDEIVNVWLHKVFDKPYNEFKESLTKQPKRASKQNLKAAIENSHAILNKFIPS